MKVRRTHVILHPIPPLIDARSRILILGSFPSVRSREEGFFYGHPQNRFWRVMAAIFHEDVPTTVEEKKHLLLSHGVALWDVLAACEIEGSADSTIRQEQPNDLLPLFQIADIQTIYVNGKTAARYYQAYLFPVLSREVICLPSTSPANAAWRLEQLIDAWRIIADDL